MRPQLQHAVRPSVEILTVLQKGERTKPDGLIGALPIWSGRLMPEDPGCTQLPSLVEAAKKIGQKQQVESCLPRQTQCSWDVPVCVVWW